MPRRIPSAEWLRSSRGRGNRESRTAALGAGRPAHRVWGCHTAPRHALDRGEIPALYLPSDTCSKRMRPQTTSPWLLRRRLSVSELAPSVDNRKDLAPRSASPLLLEWYWLWTTEASNAMKGGRDGSSTRAGRGLDRQADERVGTLGGTRCREPSDDSPLGGCPRRPRPGVSGRGLRRDDLWVPKTRPATFMKGFRAGVIGVV